MTVNNYTPDKLFVKWALSFFQPKRMGHLHDKHELFNHCTKYRKHHIEDNYTMFKFTKDLKHFCLYKGWFYNPQKKNNKGYSFFEWKDKYPGKQFIGKDEVIRGRPLILITHRPNHIY